MYGASRMATRDLATHHTRVLSLAIASSVGVGEFIVQHARAVKSGLAAPPPTTTVSVHSLLYFTLLRPCSVTSCGAPTPPPWPAIEVDPPVGGPDCDAVSGRVCLSEPEV